jgi:hypothetical protein
VKVREGAKPQIHYREFKRDFVPLQKKPSPPPYQGEGDKGDRVTNKVIT